ncbi:MAG TPA: DUF6174 domain-containing protein [Gemmatimonadaceae bacterium]|nr:DUF6174 domain-containing protein [Gemmatimonadaceae bacterium]
MDQLRQLEQYQARWRSLGIHDYSFDYRMTCCWFRTHVRYVIRADTVESAVELDSLASPNPLLRITIDTVFAQARAILAEPNLSLRIVYDTSRPYPAVVAELSPVGVDGDVTDSVSDFVPLR